MGRLALAAVVLVASLCAACGGIVPGFVFTASGVAGGQAIAQRYTCDGDDVSPALAWEGTPDGTAELALVVDDPDAPGGTFTHWLAYGLDPGTTELPEAVPEGADVGGPPAFRQGVNDMGATGYGGPCPPSGEEHRYVFRLLALDEELGLAGGASRDELFAALEGHVLGEARLTGTYAHTVG